MSGGLVVDGRVERGGFCLELALEVSPGEVVAVLGPNGAGKSTLLRAVAGLEPLAAGAVGVAGRTWEGPGVHVPAERRRAGVVFQDYRLFPHLSVVDNVAFAARSRGRGRRASREHAHGWLERLGLADLAPRRPGALSGGQAQRVAIARALASEPEVLLLDEPMAALDAGARLDVRAFLRTHLADVAGPTVLVTHDPLEAMVLADRLVVVEQGRLVQQGPPAEVAQRPASTYVARLMGLNLWRGRHRGDGRVDLVVGGTLSVAPDGPLTPGPVLVAVRPSAVALHLEQPRSSSARNSWSGRVGAMERLGERVRLQVVGGPAAPDALVDVTAAAVAELRLGPGREVWVSVKATETEVYPETPVS
ncbi:ABC transporter ATP-binding protein [Nocardioides marmoraquaticus]